MTSAGQSGVAGTKRRATLRGGMASLDATVGRMFATSVEPGPQGRTHHRKHHPGEGA